MSYYIYMDQVASISIFYKNFIKPDPKNYHQTKKNKKSNLRKHVIFSSSSNNSTLKGLKTYIDINTFFYIVKFY